MEASTVVPLVGMLVALGAYAFFIYVSKHASSVEVLEGMKAVVLPCWVPWFPEGTKVVWSHHGSNPSTVHQHQKQDEPYLQNQHFSGRTSMSDDALETGDFSLTLKEPHRSDSGLYLCTIRINENKIKMKWYQVQLQVTVPQHDSDVEVYEGVKSVVLPCQISSLPKYIKVVWSRFGFNPSTVHQHQDYAEPRFQNQLYSGRTLMSADALQTGDLSLTLKDPHLSDSGLYTCTVYSNEHIKRQTIVRLQVTVSQHASSVVVYEGIKSVMLPCQLPILPEGTKVMWSCSDLHPSTVHQHQDGDEPYLQNVFYSGRTSMSADALKTGNLSLTLKDPHYSDSGVYTCTIYSNEHIKRQISVHLQVTVSQHASNVVVYEGIKSFVLPCQLPWLPEGSLVVWSCPDLNPSTVHQHQDKDEPYLQNQLYNGRTSMSADALKTGDLGLTLKDPYHSDSGVYTCTVYSKGNMTGKKTVQLQVTESSTSSTRTDVLLAVVLAVLFLVLGLAVAVVLGLAVYFWYRIITVTWVEVEEEEMFVKLPCKTQAPLPECLSVEWSRCAPEPMKVHEYRNYTNNPVTQDEFYTTAQRWR
ncbi:uncharacterized protein LOC120549597 isoform X1 [Perca fluviatilis]|uniref:uncharacterized protein LOC120549597 isoform X1 n=2 Tax=Perca fluviatilis TaxID=8168 RepID=UPI0019667C3C|nr:uncharacterized protein LOC120549597 isoform X1 [Perca fluviatilis]XP_039642548.1 uncharacterized protein LOC120549597 isoform X1 [Perca fluviatilis]